MPLPGRTDRKRPALASFREYQSQAPPPGLYSPARWRTPNVQVMTGARTGGPAKVLVVDVDGAEAVHHWRALCRAHGWDAAGAWIARTGGGGWHVYLSLPPGLDACPPRLIWGLWRPGAGPLGRGAWAGHEEIRLLGDGLLAVAPPSLHVETGAPYRWAGRARPEGLRPPAEAPDWLLSLEPCDPSPPPSPLPAPRPRPGRARNGPRGPSRSEVLARLSPGEKLALARRWGLRTAGGGGGGGGAGWVPCHALGREDRHPSAGFDPRTGVYHAFGPGAGPALSLFSLAVATGAHRSWLDALAEAADLAGL